MRVLLDATAIPADRGGVGRYVDEILPPLVDSGVEMVVVAQERDAEHYARLNRGGEVVVAPAMVSRRPARLVWEQVGLPLLVRRAKVDVVHSPHYTFPLVSGVPRVVTLHDATFFSDPEVHLHGKGVFFRTATRLAVRRASALVVPSAATRDEVTRYVGPRSTRYFVALHGVDSLRFHAVDSDERERVARSLGLETSSYVAFLGTLEPRKNVPALIAGWVQAVGALTNPPALVLAGARGWDESIEDALRAVPSHLQVVVPGYLPLEDLAGFLGGAMVVAYPSLGEGFGLPVLEAMACGAAVLTTRRLSLPEVGGDAVEYTDVTAQAIASSLGALLADEARRHELQDAARVRAAQFTWERAAAVHREAYAFAAARG